MRSFATAPILVSQLNAFSYSMVLSIMADTTQEQEKSVAECNSMNEETCSPEKENIQTKGEAEVSPKGEVENVKAVEEKSAEKETDEEGSGGGGDGEGGGGGEEKEDTREKEEERLGERGEEEEEVLENDEDEGGDGIDEDEEDLDEEEDEEPDAEEEKARDGKVEKALDHDQDRRNPQYIPKGAFYEHDNRTSLEDVENKDPLEVEKKKKVWKESKASERWLHDWYKESEQTPKTKAEIIQIYGYDIRKEEAPPRARRRRKYGRGPDKYERNWEDEQAYMVKQNGPGRRGRKKNFGKEEFPPLPNRKNDSSVEKPVSKSQTWKKTEEEPQRNRMSKVTNQERQITGPPTNRNEQMLPQRTNALGSYSNKKIPPQTSRKINEEDIKPFRNDKNKWKSNNFRRGKDEIPKPNKTKISRQGEAQTPRSLDSNKNSSGDSDLGHLTEGFCQMTFHNKHSNVRDRSDSNEIGEQEMDSPANRLNPKRYSKNRKSFTGFFPPEDIAEIDPAEMKQIQQEQQQKNQHVNMQQQPLNIQSVIRRYPGTYNGNPGYMAATRPMIPGIPNQGMSPQGLQQALSPQGIPQQALSPQVPGLQPIELQQAPMPPQPNFVPPIYIDIDPHYGTSDMMGAYTGYASYSASQPNEMYQPSGGITYYSTECQNSNQIRPPPARRQKAAIPIVPPPE